MAETAHHDWRARGLGASWQFTFFHILIQWGGRRLALILADLVAGFYVLCRPAVRQRCRPYLDHRFPGRHGWRRLRDTYRMVKAFARAMVDGAVLGLLGAEAFDVHASGGAPLMDLVQEGHGLILVTAHVGAWQAGMLHLENLGIPVAVVNRRDDGVVAHHLERAGQGPRPLRVIDPSGYLGGIPDMTQTLLQGEVLCIMGDRGVGTCVETPFLGAPIPLPISPYKLASATGAPLAIIFPCTNAQGRQEVRLLSVMRVPPGLGRNPAHYAPYALGFAQALETFLEEHPYHFFNFYDLWQTPPQG